MEESINEKIHSKLFISFGTIFGFVVFAIVFAGFILLETAQVNPFSSRVTSAILGITIIVFLLGVIIDQLKYRNFRFWALGALVSFLGVLLFFSPVLFYGIGSDNYILWVICISVGAILILFGYTIEAYELNNKVAKILLNLWESISTFQYKKIPGRILKLVGFLVFGLLYYIGLGFRKFKSVVKRAFSSTMSFITKSVNAMVRLIFSLPGYTKKTIFFLYEYNYLIILPLFLFTAMRLLQFQLPFIFLIVLGFLFVLLVIMAILNSNEELSQRYVRSLRTRSWEALQTISIRIQKTTSSVGRYKCQNCGSPLKLGQEHCEVCEYKVKHCSICKLPIKKGQPTAVCSHCLYPAHENHWDQWTRMNNHCPICKQ